MRRRRSEIRSFKHKLDALLWIWDLLPKIKRSENKMYRLDGSEAAMLSVISDNIGAITGTKVKDYQAFHEFAAGPGIADLVFSKLNKKVVNKRRAAYYPALTSYSHLETYLTIHDSGERGVTLADLLDSLPYVSNKLTRTILPSLANEGLIQVEQDRYFSKKTYLQGVQHCIAVEAKVKDWRSGLFQAYRYKEFADDTYLAVYEDHIRPCKNNLEIFEKLNVGLIGVSTNGLTVYYKPVSRSYAKPLNKALAFERMLSFIDNRNQPFILREPFASRV